MDDSLARLQSRIGYQFQDIRLLETALTHRSAGATNNERLEFLGDALVNLSAAHILYQQNPQSSEGRLTQARSKLVRKGSLANLARNLHLQNYLKVGASMLSNGSFISDSVMEDAFEALVGAIYLDSSWDRCLEITATLFADKINEIFAEDSLRDPKTRLQEYLQGRGEPLPDYQVLDVAGPGHKLAFRVACRVSTVSESVIGEGGSRRAAEQAAAEQVLHILEEPE